jgi:AcrR family transcriptional regulator
MQIPRKSFYRYFGSKDGALQALIDHTLMEFEDYTVRYRQGKTRSIYLDMESFFQFWVEKRDFLEAMSRSNLSGILVNRAVDFAQKDDMMPVRFLPNDSPDMRKHITMFGVCGLMSLMLNWYQGGFVHSPRYMARLAVRLISQPLFPDVKAPV